MKIINGKRKQNIFTKGKNNERVRKVRTMKKVTKERHSEPFSFQP